MKKFMTMLVAVTLMFGAASAQRNLEIYITGLTEDTMAWFRDVAFPEVEAENPGVTLDILTAGWGGFDAAVAGWSAAGSGQDLVSRGSEYAATFGPLLANPDPYLADWSALSHFLPAALSVASYDGHMVGLPLLMSPRR